VVHGVKRKNHVKPGRCVFVQNWHTDCNIKGVDETGEKKQPEKKMKSLTKTQEQALLAIKADKDITLVITRAGEYSPVSTISCNIRPATIKALHKAGLVKLTRVKSAGSSALYTVYDVTAA
jgi:hypothetical protein